MGYTLDFSVVIERLPELILACLATIGLAIAGMSIATVIGIFGVVARRSPSRLLRSATIGFVELIRNTPFLVQIFFIFFALPQIGVRLNPTVTAIVALGLNGGAYAIEIIRGGVDSIGKGQVEAGLALGLHRAQILRHIILKPALRAVYPSLTSQFVMLTLTTSVCTSIAAYELTSVAQKIEADTFRSFEVYFSITLLYLVISSLMMGAFALISRIFFSYPVK
ncbi:MULTISPECIES: amino acid ABC transporter permease [Rhizobium/Agrobacterium group]|uniref:amino acid ABC transporter permease n=1 Tax=Rhizobium/Agrobacterium group TaxID=227290 RepID=UPI0012E9097A|nr:MULTISPECIES: amino acid ABC transporter permease [Rhizobium/Agrobacterium group]MCF1472086.1 amino acid ABC transporter permease [Allorhizobium ampelinum]MVA49286.1 ABC transporter permease subunit [Agrobacterium vitis]NSZ54732.1 amino acid ABC transporter permease [Agrobacterium vitis]NTA33724.1 amino acid ABC transporter permease [Agrobacterium vitis]